MKVGIILDNKIHKRVLQHFELLKNTFDITVFVGERNDYDVSAIDLKKHFLRHFEEYTLAIREPLTAYKRVLRAPHKRMDFYYFSLRKYLKGIDVVYSCDVTRSAYTLASLKEQFGFKLILSWWENIPYRAIFDEKTNFQKSLIMKKVDLFLPFTESAKKVLLIEGVSEEKIRVISPGVDLDRFKPGVKPTYLLDKYNIPKSSFNILYVGKLTSWKGVHNLIYMAKILKVKGLNDFIVAVAGRGAQKENMKKLIKETDTTQLFRFLDFVSYDEIPDVYRMTDVFVLPSYPTMTWQEQFGMVLVEAMACGKAVISTNTGSIPEVVGDAGILVPSGNFFQMALEIANLMENRKLLTELGKRGRERVEVHFDAKKNSLKLYDVFKNILSV